MFYNHKKIIYSALLILALLGGFLFGQNINNSKISSKKILGQSTLQNTNYNTTLSVKGIEYSLDYSITTAYFINKSTMNFNVNIQNNHNINLIKVVVKDQNNNSLVSNMNASTDPNILNYNVNLTSDVKKISITVYPLNKDMSNNTNLDLISVPYQNSVLYVSLIKKQQIEDLQD